MNRIHLALSYAFGSRINDYRHILVSALDADYKVCSVEQSLIELKENTEKLLVLRHDVDHISPGTIAMADVESCLGVTSTYYFRLNTLNHRDVDLVKNAGHEVSFHYETIADYAADNGITEKSVMMSNYHLESCARRLKHELDWFRIEAGTDCHTVASHGASLNRRLGIPNRMLFEMLPDLANLLKVQIEAYAPSYLGQFDRYISDTQWEINDGFRYGFHPEQAIVEGIPRVILLTHPNHWSFTPRVKMRRIIKCLLLGRVIDSGVFAESDRLRNTN